MSVLCVIQARLGSSRLPRKALMDIGGKPMIRHVVERVLEIPSVDDVVLAVPAGEVRELCYCSYTIAPDVPENDVLSRFAAAVQLYPEHDTILRVTGDCPLFDPDVAEAVIRLYRDAKAWYAWNCYPGYCDGEDVEVFSRSALIRANELAIEPGDREHVTPWIRRTYPVVTLKPTHPGRRKTSVDTLEDLEYVRALYAKISGAETC